MKKIILVFILSINFTNAQRVLIEKNISRENESLDKFYNPSTDKFFIGYGKSIGGLVVGMATNTINSYDRKTGTESVFLENQKLYGSFLSSDENAFISSDISKGILRSKTKFISFNGKEVIAENKALKGIQVLSFSGQRKIAFNNSIVYNLTNKKGELNIDLKKDKDLKVETFDFNDLKRNSLSLEPIKIDRLINESTIKSKAQLGVKFELENNNTFSLITKSINKDYKKMTLYRTYYSNEGKVINENSYTVDLKENILLYSRNGGGETTLGGYDGKFTHFDDDNSINNYYIDKNSGDLYIYGLFGNDISPLNTQGNPKGYYVFKFDKSGNKIWESIKNINDSDFIRDHAMVTVYNDLIDLKNGNICFSIKINGLKDYFMYSIISKDNGTISNFKELNFNQTFAHLEQVYSNEYKVNSDFKEDNNFKNKVFNFNAIIALNNDKRIFDYIKSYKAALDTNFYTHFEDKFTWIYVVDKKSFRIVLFE